MKVGLNGSSVVSGMQTYNIGMFNKINKGSISTNESAKNSAAVIFSSSPLKPNVSDDTLKDFTNDLARLKLSLQNSSDRNSDSKLLDEFMTKYNDFKEKGIFGGQADDQSTNQIFQNSFLDLVDEVNAKLVNEHCQNNIKEMKARGDMAMFLVRALGITSGAVHVSEEGISRMMKLYEEKLKDGTLNSDYVEILDLDAFNTYREKNKKDIEEAIKERDAYGVLLQKLAGFKNSLVQDFKGK
ncbi:hypothetical protein AEA09_06965 [Lysinibacillus contaminans]|uniref:Flagellar hook-associated protein 2 C-terminal domain-containing protein n=1 Tax=Lysinibacillus contaminans TaxID=1293441 RepID=A0ABR5K0E3_9BACI|nr:hypothetical protein [Lysinibacillus contaminans]KOS68321.1 hypothetical protein AEA09_06965 [Lysinibacillus contaminans]